MSEFDTGYKIGVKEALGEIEKLRRQLDEANKVIEFYGHKDTLFSADMVINPELNHSEEGGEKARQYLENIKVSSKKYKNNPETKKKS